MHSSYFLVASSKAMVLSRLSTFRNLVEDVAVSFDVNFFFNLKIQETRHDPVE